MAVAPPIWTLVLTDLQGAILGEITNADEKQIVLPLNRLATVQFKIPLAHPLANTIVATDTLVKAYRWDRVNAPRLVFVGPVMTVEEVAERDNQSISVNAVSPLWRMTKRLLGTTKDGIAFGTVDNKREIVQIAADILATINGEEYTGIAQGTLTYNTPNNMTKVGPYHLKNAAETIAELAASVNAFDYEIVPQEPTISGLTWPTIGSMNIVPYIGTNRPDAVFEYGGGQANVIGYNRAVSREGMMTKGYITSPGWPDGTSKDLVVQENTLERTARGLFQDQIGDGGVEDDATRGAMIGEHLYYRAHPREIINLTVAQNARPWWGSDYTVGDSVRARAVVRGIVRFDAMFRIWGATFAVDKNGNETTTIELVMP